MNPSSSNWWENQIGVQLRFSRIALFMESIVSKDAMDIMLNKLLEKHQLNMVQVKIIYGLIKIMFITQLLQKMGLNIPILQDLRN